MKVKRVYPVQLFSRFDLLLFLIRREEIDVAVRGDELLVGVRDARRRISLPASVAGSAVASVRLRRGVLEIAFES